MTIVDLGNGFMVIGTVSVSEARDALKRDDHRFASPTIYQGRGSVWMTTGPGEVWT